MKVSTGKSRGPPQPSATHAHRMHSPFQRREHRRSPNNHTVAGKAPNGRAGAAAPWSPRRDLRDGPSEPTFKSGLPSLSLSSLSNLMSSFSISFAVSSFLKCMIASNT